MTPIFGFPVYPIKKCLFSEIKLQERSFPKIDFKGIAGHKDEATIRRYSLAG